MSAVCNVNGKILPEHDATLPVLDRGFLFGDSVYEVMRTRFSVPFAWPEHLARLRASADGIGLRIDLDDHTIMRRVKETLAAAKVEEAYIRIIVTRGTGTAPNIDLDFAPGPSNYLVLVRDLVSTESTAELALIPRLRTDRRALDPAIKSGNYLNNLLGLAEARAKGATDCLFLNQQGHVTEASTSNFYLVEGETITTPPPNAGLLPGITRGLLFEFCADLHVPLRERDLAVGCLDGADEMFLSSTLRDIVAVTAIDGRPVNDGHPGPLTNRLARQFEEFCGQRTRERYAAAFEAI
jgi:branched-chain amino acid aminotransferase